MNNEVANNEQRKKREGWAGSPRGARRRTAKRDDQENVERRETGDGTGAAADERKPLDGDAGVRRGKRTRGAGGVRVGRLAEPHTASSRGAWVNFASAGGD